MADINTSDFRQGMNLEVDGQPWVIVTIEFVKPGKGQAFNRVKLKNLLTQRVIERTYKSGEKEAQADIVDTKMRMLYKEGDSAIFMDDKSFEQVAIKIEIIGDNAQWLLEDLVYDILFYKGEAVAVQPPTFLELVITQTDPGARGNTASGRVMKPAVLESGAKIQVPIFVEEGEKIKVDTRTGEYVSRVS